MSHHYGLQDVSQMRSLCDEFKHAEGVACLMNNPMRIAIVDDSADVRELLKAEFEYRGWAVMTFDSALSAAEYLFFSPQPDVILCDFQMPVSDGIELFHALTEIRVRTPFFLMTGDLDLCEQSTLALGIAGLFRKPFKTSEIIKTIKSKLIRRIELELTA